MNNEFTKRSDAAFKRREYKTARPVYILDALCEDMQADREKMETKLQNIDYTYDENTNQFV